MEQALPRVKITDEVTATGRYAHALRNIMHSSIPPAEKVASLELFINARKRIWDKVLTEQATAILPRLS